jgi:hypothetical protein
MEMNKFVGGASDETTSSRKRRGPRFVLPCFVLIDRIDPKPYLAVRDLKVRISRAEQQPMTDREFGKCQIFYLQT